MTGFKAIEDIKPINSLKTMSGLKSGKSFKAIATVMVMVFCSPLTIHAEETANAAVAPTATVEVDSSREMSITTDPAGTNVTYTISSADAVPVSGPSGVTIPLTGVYDMDYFSWSLDKVRSALSSITINWESPSLTLP